MKTSGNKTYTIKFLKNVIEKEIPALPAKIKLMVQEAIKKRLTVDPFNLGKPLCHSFRGQYRIRVSNYRIIYIINHSERKVLITAVGYRKNIYKHRRLHNEKYKKDLTAATCPSLSTRHCFWTFYL